MVHLGKGYNMVYRTMSVVCDNDAHVLLSEYPNGEGKQYEIALGANGNTQNYLRKSPQGENIHSVAGAFCQPGEHVEFTVSI